MTEKSFVRLLAEKAMRRPSAVYATFEGRTITFMQMHRASDAIAREFELMGLARGDRVAVMMRNSPDSIAVLYGIAKSGLVWVPINVQQRGEGLRYLLQHADPSVIIADLEFIDTIRTCGAGRELTVIAAKDPHAEIDIHRLARRRRLFSAAAPRPEDLFAISYTSGTTGRPKGVMVTHRMLAFAAQGAILTSQARDGDVFFVWEPLYHIGGAQLIAIPLFIDLRLAMVRHLSASRFWEQVTASGATQIHYLGGVLQILLKQPESANDRRHKVRLAWGAGLPVEYWKPFERRFGISLVECYGMTETSSFTTCNLGGVEGSVGQPVPWLDYDILDEQGRVLPPGVRGEIVVRERQAGAIFDGYFRDPEATARALRPTGMHSGDLGCRDGDGNLFFLGRMTDSLRVRGENVSAFEVEHVALGHPAVEAAAVIGVESDIGEQDIKLFVKKKPGCPLDLAELSAWLAERLAKYQNPRYLALVEEFPYTPSQRIMKHMLPATVAGCFDRARAACTAGAGQMGS